MKLSDIAKYVVSKVDSTDVSLDEYVTTDCILQDKRGRTCATNLPPNPCKLIHYERGDVLVANIRPYLKKVWFADMEGGASSDVLVFRASNGHSSKFLYATLIQDSFFDYVMQGAKGSKMPRGDKDQIMRYELPASSSSEESIGRFIFDIDKKISLNRAINQNLEALAKQLYDYWFVQFDFPNEEGKPYKSSGGKMVWNDELQMDIPEAWNVCRLSEFICKNNTGDWGADEYSAKTPIEVGCIRGADIVKLNGLPKRYIKESNKTKLLSEWDVVIEVSGGSPVQATGRSAFITPGVIKRNGGKLTCSNFCHAFSFSDFRYSSYFIYVWKMFYDNNIMFNYEGKTSGIKNFMTETFLANKWVKVPEEIAYIFFNRVKELYAKIDANIEENNYLIKQRGELLPLLMNGQVSLNSDYIAPIRGQ